VSCALPGAFFACRQKRKTKIEVITVMAIFHSHLQIITRGIGKSSVGAAAYRSGDALFNEYDGTSHDYGRKGGIIHTEIFLPEFAPREYADRNTLWNAVEKIEKQKNAQLAREINVALPKELTLEQNLSLIRKYVAENFVNSGMVADVAVHIKDEDNPHAHIMLTMRPFKPDGSWDAKAHKVNGKKVCTTDWNEHSKATEWRESWANLCNEYLAAGGYSDRIDHRSYTEQGIDQIPTVHLGVSATQMERRGIRTERGDINRAVAVGNSELRQLRARIMKTKSWLDEQRGNTPPTLYEVLSAINSPDSEKSHYRKITDLKLAAKTLVFIQENNISDLPDLADKVSEMHSDFAALSTNSKATQKRIDRLKEHLRQSENFKQYGKIAAQYDALHVVADAAEKTTGMFAKSKAEKAWKETQDFYRGHESEIGMYRATEKYLKGVLQKRFEPKKLPPIKMWRGELQRETCGERRTRPRVLQTPRRDKTRRNNQAFRGGVDASGRAARAAAPAISEI
jgi:hypothetical protein